MSAATAPVVEWCLSYPASWAVRSDRYPRWGLRPPVPAGPAAVALPAADSGTAHAPTAQSPPVTPGKKSPPNSAQKLFSSNPPSTYQPLVLLSIRDLRHCLSNSATPRAPLTRLRCRTLIDVETPLKGTKRTLPALAILAAFALAATSPAVSPSQSSSTPAAPSSPAPFPAVTQPISGPPTNPGFFPLNQ